MKTMLTLVVATSAACLFAGTAWPASHSDAPLIKQDPQANITDVYTFVGTRYDDSATKVLNVIVHVRPFSEPGDGVMYDRFADDALYSIHLADEKTGRRVITYDFSFSAVNPSLLPGLKNPNTILSYGLGTTAGAIQNIGDAQQNYTQTYSVEKREARGRSFLLGRDLLIPPPNVGRNVTPFYNDANGVAISGATTFANLDRYTQQALYALPTGEAVFAGPATTASSRIPRASSTSSTRAFSGRTGPGRPVTASTASKDTTCWRMRYRFRSISSSGSRASPRSGCTPRSRGRA
jgi:hypothetical protein